MDENSAEGSVRPFCLGLGIPDPQAAGSVARGWLCSLPPSPAARHDASGNATGFLLGCAIPDSLPPAARCGCGTLHGPGVTRGAAGC